MAAFANTSSGSTLPMATPTAQLALAQTQIPSYNYNTADLLAQLGPEGAVNQILQWIRTSVVPFPLQRGFQLPAETLFANLQQFIPTVKIDNFRLNSYKPNFASYLPPLFRDQPVQLITDNASYDQIDVLSDLFQEEQRLQAKRYDQEKSLVQCWQDDVCITKIIQKVLEKPAFNPRNFREAMYENFKEATVFSPSWGRGLLQIVYGKIDELGIVLADPSIFAGKKMLDISAGWGDRLLVAMSLKMDYLGYDPNLNLKYGYNEMIRLFGDPTKHRIIYEPFETATVPGGPYDVILTSPPYFSIEEYVPGQEGQSIVSYPEKSQWMIWFMYRALANAWNQLKEGGYLILHLGDSINRDDEAKSITLAEPVNIFIENYLVGASWEGVIGLGSRSNVKVARPVWVWKKISSTETVPFASASKVWQPDERAINGGKALPFRVRTLLRTYPEFQAELVRYYATRYSSTYAARLHNYRLIANAVKVRTSEIKPEIVKQVLGDYLVVVELLDLFPPDEVVNRLVQLSQQLATENSAVLTPIVVDLTSTWDEMLKDHPYYLKARANGRYARTPDKWSLKSSSQEGLHIFDDMMIDSLLKDLGEAQLSTWINALLLMVYPNRVPGVRS